MGRLIYSVICSLDGLTADTEGRFDFAMPDEEVHRDANAQMEPVTLQLYGRRMYELMTPWENDPGLIASSPEATEFATLWQRSDKVVFSTTLQETSTRRTTLERSFDPVTVRALVDDADGEVTIDGPTLAAHALRAGIVDEVRQVLLPVVVGAGLPVFPADVRLDLELLDQRRFRGGAVALRYAARRSSPDRDVAAENPSAS
ncbi:dihydrofolate reductase family protein [Serinicoccus sp. LYQ131]|uniref:dihydrofolate reductase family protein n=1 Tax=Serinicoccus sp. LYQ131 TaxID=3378797 RepID=UPI0038520D6E